MTRRENVLVYLLPWLVILLVVWGIMTATAEKAPAAKVKEKSTQKIEASFPRKIDTRTINEPIRHEWGEWG